MGRASSTLSKKRYAELKARLERGGALSEEQVTLVLTTLREVMDFDPSEKQYTKEQGRKVVAGRRAKAASLGVSVYALRHHRLAEVVVPPAPAFSA